MDAKEGKLLQSHAANIGISFSTMVSSEFGNDPPSCKNGTVAYYMLNGMILQVRHRMKSLSWSTGPHEGGVT